MEGNTTIHSIVFITFLHMPVHIGIYQTEDNRLIAHQCLVMTFCIRYGLFIFTTIGYFPEHAGGFPIFVYFFFDGLDPIIGDIHCHTVVKTIASIFNFSSKTGHSRYFFSNRYCFGIYFVDKFVGKCQVANGIVILMAIEVVSIVTESFTQSVTVIEHRCYTIKAETVESVFLKPVLTVGEKEMNHFIFSIVETK